MQICNQHSKSEKGTLYEYIKFENGEIIKHPGLEFDSEKVDTNRYSIKEQ